MKYNKLKATITLSIIAMMFSIGICVQLKTIKAADISGNAKLTDSNLKKSLLQWKANCEDSSKKLEQTSTDLEIAIKNATQINLNEESRKKLEKYQILLGKTNVSGEGIVITLADNTDNNVKKNSFASLNQADFIIHDGNLISIVNELKAGGAEAISINNKRITEESCITCAGNVIQVNGEKVGSPFEIKAIGSKDLLYGELTKNMGTIDKLKKYGIKVNITKMDNVEIMKSM